ncbi:hypothetical protein HK097_010108 [Rhizophlyctis rosea]|uniref:Uncharacterized protein n=1 Tax=Rhizophlyctis rosea TaxID=64517 RepID=A0AAD5S825_9FUNG|nr:hypothetical protein HK097_010108 [Rhizophlyctis rosea]
MGKPPQPSDLFNKLSFTLQMTFEPGQKGAFMPPLVNQFVKPDALPTRIYIDASGVQIWQKGGGKLRSPTSEEWDSVALDAPEITFRSEAEGEPKKTFRAANGKWFSVRELVGVVEKWEQEDRVRSDWFGGVDAHHIFFEGVEIGDDGFAFVAWGS